MRASSPFVFFTQPDPSPFPRAIFAMALVVITLSAVVSFYAMDAAKSSSVSPDQQTSGNIISEEVQHRCVI
ncbi:hypothetical protein V5799_025259 [Amblyomma americanum]|uniref:Uncharacterized protein n=1 Tax=Amblyomma americanum TaxID=6943 RepID=A0AAQ4E9P9_AMBAM